MNRITPIILAVLVGLSCTAARAADVKSPFRDAVEAGPFLYLSGNIGSVPAGEDPHGTGFDHAVQSAMDGLGATLKKHVATFNDVVKCTVMLSDMRDWPRFNETYRSYFAPDRLPARSAFGGVQLAFNAALEVECIAYRPALTKP